MFDILAPTCTKEKILSKAIKMAQRHKNTFCRFPIHVISQEDALENFRHELRTRSSVTLAMLLSWIYIHAQCIYWFPDMMSCVMGDGHPSGSEDCGVHDMAVIWQWLMLRFPSLSRMLHSPLHDIPVGYLHKQYSVTQTLKNGAEGDTTWSWDQVSAMCLFVVAGWFYPILRL